MKGSARKKGFENYAGAVKLIIIKTQTARACFLQAAALLSPFWPFADCLVALCAHTLCCSCLFITISKPKLGETSFSCNMGPDALPAPSRTVWEFHCGPWVRYVCYFLAQQNRSELPELRHGCKAKRQGINTRLHFCWAFWPNSSLGE